MNYIQVFAFGMSCAAAAGLSLLHALSLFREGERAGRMERAQRQHWWLDKAREQAKLRERAEKKRVLTLRKGSEREASEPLSYSSCEKESNG